MKISPEDRLRAFEEMLSSVQVKYRETGEQMDHLKAEGREKSAAFRQLMSTRLQLRNILALYQACGLTEDL